MTSCYGGIEAGGTKFVCAIGTGPDDLRAEIRIPTTDPDETLGRVIAFFREHAQADPVAAIGIASFGPIDPDPTSPTFGYLTSTPKPGWVDIDLVGSVASALRVPVGFDTDVNGAALAEGRWGSARGLDTFCYLTIGTGIGGGVMVGGQPLHGLLHPEVGHMLLPRRDDDTFSGACPYHRSCFEGLASGPAIAQRWGTPACELPEDHPAWELEAHYLAVGVANLVCALSPQRVILGGGVMRRRQLFPWVRRNVRELLNGYIQIPAITEDNDTFIVPPGLAERSGVLGAFELAERALAEEIDL